MTENKRQSLADRIAEGIRSRPLPFSLDRRGGIITAAIPAQVIRLAPKVKRSRKRKQDAIVLQLDLFK